MLSELKTQLQKYIEETLHAAYPKEAKNLPAVTLDIPADRTHGEFSSNIALKSTKILKKPPLEIAEEIKKAIEAGLAQSPLKSIVHKVEVKKPGFINFFLSKEAVFSILEDIFRESDKYGCSSFGKGQKIQIEFVSANPTGPLSLAHARQAAVGDALGNILRALGCQVTKEYYVNDRGNQIVILGRSVKLRALEHLGETIEFPEDCYQGDYISDMARQYLEERDITTVEGVNKQDEESFKKFSVDYLLAIIKKELTDFRVIFDVWSSETKIATKENIQAVLDYLGEKGFLYEKDGALWFKSTDFDDDKDRVLEKSDGTYTYITPDIVYHKNKFERGFNKVINIWGPDHHGYIPRLKAAVEALGYDRSSLEVLIVQLATIFRNGEAVSMSTRRGQYVSLQEIMDEVGVDAARFFFLMRGISAHLDFDLELAKKQTPENPVYYVQYAHARVHSINKKAQETNTEFASKGFSRFKEPEELDLIKTLGTFPDVLEICYNQLDPSPLVNYLQEVAAGFHRFYDHHRVVSEDARLSQERLGLVNAVRIVLANGLHLLGLNAPQQM